ncbi:MAG: hypothetical protein K1X81_01045 [Bacteroidia bacterium]|nr:hypothetical protein [Bacteroidia bacterium]
MKKYVLFWFLLIAVFAHAANDSLITPFEKSKGTQTATVAQCFAYYRMLAGRFPDWVQCIQPEGQPFPMVLVKMKPKQEDGFVIMINNGIHPGEPDGVDATMMLVRDICTGKFKLHQDIELRIIPFYNVSGGLRRGKYSRANQNGPEEYGFRGNGQNLDLNRDLIKGDAIETRWFKEVFWYNKIPADLFLETHVSNGADYQHTLTILPTQHNQLGMALGAYQHDSLMPAIYNMLHERKIEACPYVNHFSTTPDSGWVAFFDSPRFSSGYASINNCMAVLSETHMLKPFKQRVEHTQAFLEVMLDYCYLHKREMRYAIQKQFLNDMISMQPIGVAWETDSFFATTVTFNGYQAGKRPSNISGAPRLYYDRSKPYMRKVKYYDCYKPIETIRAPRLYLVPLAYQRLIEELQRNRVLPDSLRTLIIENDTMIKVQVYRIDSFKTVTKPYEGHYLHYHTVVSSETRSVFIPGGTYIVINAENPLHKKFLVNTLEPSAPDSYFNWNFFDGILQQKEGYSDYVFEDAAADILKKQPALREEFLEKKKKDAAFAASPQAQLDWVYKHSVYYEGTVNLYPVYRIN